MAWNNGIDWAKKLGTKVAVQETVPNKAIRLNNLPVSVIIDGRTWYRTSQLSNNRTYSYVKCPSQNIADTSVAAYDHITVSGDSADNNSYVILNAHLTYLDGGTVHYYPADNQYSENPPPKELREFVVQIFFKVITVMK